MELRASALRLLRSAEPRRHRTHCGALSSSAAWLIVFPVCPPSVPIRPLPAALFSPEDQGSRLFEPIIHAISLHTWSSCCSFHLRCQSLHHICGTLDTGLRAQPLLLSASGPSDFFRTELCIPYSDPPNAKAAAHSVDMKPPTTDPTLLVTS